MHNKEHTTIINKSMKKHIFLLFTAVLLTITTAWAQTPAQNAALSLKETLRTLISQHTSVGYDNLWTSYLATDKTADGYVWDIYGLESYHYVYGSSKQGANYDSEGDSFNREHSVPQSWFGEKEPMKSDLFQVYPTDGYVNNKRANYPYGEVDTATYTSANGSKLGTCKSEIGYDGTVFEPVDEYKGDIARTYFYMATCYGDKVNSWTGGVFSTTNTFTDIKGYPGIQEWALRMFIRWAKNDPVSQKEIDRNNAIYKIQGNRNPFIDCPGLERFIWSDYIN